MLCTVISAVKAERSRMRKTIQHSLILCYGSRCQPVIFLVKEKACLLAVLYIHGILDTVLCYLGNA